jgi:hypothetical protein
MSNPTPHRPHTMSPRPFLLGMIGTALAIATGLGIADLVLDEPTATTQTPTGIPTQGDGYFVNGTDREVRGLMHLR